VLPKICAGFLLGAAAVLAAMEVNWRRMNFTPRSAVPNTAADYRTIFGPDEAVRRWEPFYRDR
jgi:hypothetical protein